MALGLEHRLHSPYEKSLMEGFDDYYPCMRRGCGIAHVRNWLNIFVDMHYARGGHVIRFRDLTAFLSGAIRLELTGPAHSK